MAIPTCYIKSIIQNKAPNWLFCIAYNTSSFIKRNGIYCIPYGRTLKVSNGIETRFASTKTRALTYLGGISERSNYLANVYHLDCIQFNKFDLVVDCGANMGDLYQWFKLRELEIDYIGYEPNPIDFECLKKNVREGSVKNIGLWEVASTLDFFVSTEVASSSFIQPPFYSEILKINTVRLDSEIRNRSIKLLKLEAEGAEPEVLRGALGLLSSIEYISADVGPERGPTEESTRDEVVQYLLSNGFKIEKENIGHRRTILFRKVL
jgi:FkbM family methyltransferase